ncbi:MAG: response regulator transcription factor [Chloroflexota bacterium]
MSKKQRILVVDDDREIARLVRQYLEKAEYEVLTAYNGADAWTIIQHEDLDLVVLDLMMPEMDGWEVTKRVRSTPRIADLFIIMLTARVDETDRIVGLEMGADDYLPKPFNPREVVARAKTVLRRLPNANPDEAVTVRRSQVLQAGTLRLDTSQQRVTNSGTELELTQTEYKLLQLLMENPGYVFARIDLIEQALGYEYIGMERTLDTHIKNLRRKIEADPKKPEYILTVYGVGYRFAG